MEQYVKVPIFPLTQYLTKAERQKIPAPMRPVSFFFGEDFVEIDEVISCERAASRRVGGRGFRFVCRVSWTSGDNPRSRQSVLWFDDFLDEWFVEVQASRAPVDWDAATQLEDVGEHYEDGDY